MESIYSELGLEGFAEARPAMEAYLDSVKQYKRNIYRPLAQSTLKKVHSAWDFWFKEFGYAMKEKK